MNISDFRQLITQKNLILELKNPYVVTVKNEQEGFALTRDVLYQICDKKTLLLLSGGRTPKQLYHLLSEEEKLMIGAAGLIDERYGKRMHEDSNEWMIRKSGLLGYLEYRKTPFYSVLENNTVTELTSSQKASIESLTNSYDQTLRMVLQNFSKSVGILGIGLDGHTAGIPIKHEIADTSSLMTYVTDFPGPLQERITMTFLGLSMLDIMLVLVFGDDKKEILEKFFEEGSEKEISARFFKRADIAAKTLVITDQQL